jgi:hypothetical protein
VPLHAFSLKVLQCHVKEVVRHCGNPVLTRVTSLVSSDALKPMDNNMRLQDV